MLVLIHMFFGILKLIRMFKISKFQNGRRKRPFSKMAALFKVFFLNYPISSIKVSNNTVSSIIHFIQGIEMSTIKHVIHYRPRQQPYKIKLMLSRFS